MVPGDLGLELGAIPDKLTSETSIVNPAKQGIGRTTFVILVCILEEVFTINQH